MERLEIFRDKEQLKSYFLKEMTIPELDNRISKIKEFLECVHTSTSLSVFQFISKEDEGYLAMEKIDDFYLFDKCPEGIFVTDGNYNLVDFDMKIIEDEFEMVFMDKTFNVQKSKMKDYFAGGRHNIHNSLNYEKLLYFFERAGYDENYLLEYLKKKRTINMLKEKNGST